MNFAMQQGIEKEAAARAAYSFARGPSLLRLPKSRNSSMANFA